MDIIKNRDLLMEINNRLDRLEKNIIKKIDTDIMNGAFYELQDFKEWISERQQRTEVSEQHSSKALNLANVINQRGLFENMQYYMEYCQRKGYVTPQDWIERHKHF